MPVLIKHSDIIMCILGPEIASASPYINMFYWNSRHSDGIILFGQQELLNDNNKTSSSPPGSRLQLKCN